MNVHKGWACPRGIYSEVHSPITTPEIICVMALTLQPIRGCPQHSGETGTRLSSAIYRRLLSRFFLREGRRLYTGQEMYKQSTNNTNNTQLTFHPTDLPTWQTEPNARNRNVTRFEPLFQSDYDCYKLPVYTKRILPLLTFHSFRGSTQNGRPFMYFILQHLPCWSLFLFCDITDQLVASLLSVFRSSATSIDITIIQLCLLWLGVFICFSILK